ncbi:MAG: hypothetical protein LBP22_14470 [Deltaproteobacteria bacterium]|jgi:hypothetical protein|nr:hypothetical protein [Deltaproteobacteria bacterium]
MNKIESLNFGNRIKNIYSIFLDYIGNKILYITIFLLLLLLCLYILFLQSVVPPKQVPAIDSTESNIQESNITVDDQRTYYSSKFINGSFKGTFVSPWYLADRDFAVDVGGWLGHSYFENNAQELQLFIQDSNNKLYQVAIPGVNRSYYNTANINLKPESSFKFRIITKGDSSNSQGWLSFSAPYYPEIKPIFSNFLSNSINFILKFIFIIAIILLILCKRHKLQFLLIVFGLTCFFIVDFTPIGIVPYTPRSSSAQRIFVTNDGSGYYAYLQELFIDGYKPEGGGSLFILDNGRVGNIYPIGVAILEAPFFLTARTISNLAGLHLREGLNEIFQLFSAISSAFYFLLGICFIYKFINKLTNKKFTIFIILSLVYGTNLLFYASGSWGLNYSHIYSFSLISIFLYLIPGFYEEKGKNIVVYSVIIGILIGIITCLRLHNCLFVIVFLFYNINSINEAKKRIRSYLPYYFLSLIISLIFFIPQIYWWYTHTGHFIVNMYGKIDTGFNFLNPEILNFAFSIHKGLFFWTPLWLFGYLAIFIKDPLSRNWRLSLAIFLALKFYMCSSWYCWWYGGSYGQREYVDVLCLLAVGLTVFFNYLSSFSNSKHFFARNSLKIFSAVVIIMICVNLIFTKSIIQGIIPFDFANIKNIYNAFRAILVI